MSLPVYSSTADNRTPNLVGLQHPALAALPTQLVCPLREKIAVTPLREVVFWNRKKYIAACDLIRPINRKALKKLGELDEETSDRILRTFARLLAVPGEPDF
ncbi:MAG: hypothetical protein ACOYMS_10725 [Terrimicrobiaceae bacterium]